MRQSTTRELVLVCIAFTVLACGVDGIDRAIHHKIRADSRVLASAIRDYEKTVFLLEDGQALTILSEPDPNVPSWKPIDVGTQDPWGNAYIIRVDSKTGNKQVWSLGFDGKKGGTEKAADFAIEDESNWPTWLKAKIK